jgi:hypothetical protein
MMTLDKNDNMTINEKGQGVLVLRVLDYSSDYSSIYTWKQQFGADKFVSLLATEI